jgi:hypothetical protein
MRERLHRELELVARKFGELEIGPNLDWFIVKRLPLGVGWSKNATQVVVTLPGGYPTTPPDNFHADPDLRLASGAAPGNTSPAQQAVGRTWLLFSYHVESGDWQPDPVPENGHNLLTFLEGIARRLREAN